MSELLSMTAVEIGKKLKDRTLSEQEVLSAFYQRAEALNQGLNAFLCFSKEEAFRQAEAVAERRARGEELSVLAGVPIALKDNLSVKGMKTTCGSRALEDYVPPYDATAVARLLQAGLLPFGKTNMDEFAMGSTSETSYFLPVSHPLDESRVPGGSSGGSAAAVASMSVPLALGTDTGGSVRQPAAYCGITGFLPTYGSVSRYGLIAYASSLDQIGPMAKTAEDVAAVFDIICAKDERDATSKDHPERLFYRAVEESRERPSLRGKRIGIPSEELLHGVAESVRLSLQRTESELAALGAELVTVKLPFLSYVIPAYYMISTAEASSNLSRFDGVKYGYRSANAGNISELFQNTRSGGFGTEVKNRILLGTFVLSAGHYEDFYQRARTMRRHIEAGMGELFTRCDAVLLPTTPDIAPKKGEMGKDCLKMYLSDIFTALANLAGIPAISFPCGTDGTGMPVGMQLMGSRWSDKELLCMVAAYQKEYQTVEV